MGIYEELGLRRVINGNATLTRLGGSLMPPEVLAAMAEAAGAFVDIEVLQARVGEEIARLTRNEAAYVSCGAAAGLVLSTAACMTGLDPEKRERLPNVDGMKHEVIVHRGTRTPYDFAIRQTGAKLVLVGTAERTAPEELEAAITEQTAAIFYFPNAHRDHIAVPLDQAIEIAHRHGVPLIVDAAAQLPPASNLWTFTHRGADLALFSGGKGLCGPQSSGLSVGRRDLIEAIRFNGPPKPFIGRPMKVGKEEMVGLLAAVRWYLSLDHEALLDRYERQVQAFIDALGNLPGLAVRRDFPNEAGQPMPRAEITVDPARLGLTAEEMLRQLLDGDPCIDLGGGGGNRILVNPQTLAPDEEQIIIRRIEEIVERRSRRRRGR
ncbi:MAG: aminotransferase class V-fold PLP-dependent enzyme [Candidatus Latescibacteria bacterium]|nr:aminotransferase class V-fold PLP-dependent enzyme [Candidatus Latescibacterota bacterium]